MNHMVSNQLFTTKQHSFISGRSFTTQLLTPLNDCSESLDKGHSVDVIYLDFCKAFNVVPHVRLIAKLKAYMVLMVIFLWIESFLVGRKQCVVINNSGAPQGSILGPLLFNLYVNDIPSLVSSPILLFADDKKIYRPKKITCCFSMMLNYYWSALNCGNLNSTSLSVAYYILANLITISSLDTVKDLRMYVDTNFKFHTHTSMVAPKLIVSLVSSKGLLNIQALRLY